MMIFDKIEKIEISVRAKLSYILSLKYSPHWQDNPVIFDLKTNPNSNLTVFDEIQKHIKKDLQNNKAEIFIKHYKNKYSYPENPPSWMCIEIMYFSQISKIFQHLKNRKDRTDIAREYQLPEEIFGSWLHTINYIRNICAHHSRLWNRDFQIVPKEFISKSKKWINRFEIVPRNKFYYFICMVIYILDSIDEENNSRDEFIEFMNNNPNINYNLMGFPKDWQSDSFWNK
jgi:abortive infection bacteriophage resistance protein